jgi:PAS domain-containing protein
MVIEHGEEKDVKPSRKLSPPSLLPSGKPLYKDKEIIGAQCLSRDITERKKAE